MEPAARSTPAHWLSRRAALQSPSADLEFSGAGVLHAFVSLGRRRSRGVGLRAVWPHPSFAYSRFQTEVVVVSGPLGAHTDTPPSPRRVYKHRASLESCSENQSCLQRACAFPVPIVLERQRGAFQFQSRVLNEGLVLTTKLSKFRILPHLIPPLNHLLDSK